MISASLVILHHASIYIYMYGNSTCMCINMCIYTYAHRYICILTYRQYAYTYVFSHSFDGLFACVSIICVHIYGCIYIAVAVPHRSPHPKQVGSLVRPRSSWRGFGKMGSSQMPGSPASSRAEYWPQPYTPHLIRPCLIHICSWGW